MVTLLQPKARTAGGTSWYQGKYGLTYNSAWVIVTGSLLGVLRKGLNPILQAWKLRQDWMICGPVVQFCNCV